MHIVSNGWDIEGLSLRCNIQLPETDVGRCLVLILRALLNLRGYVKSHSFNSCSKVILAQVSVGEIVIGDFACKHLAKNVIMKICCPLIYNRN